MKGLFLTAALGEVCVSSFAQGTLNFANAGVGFEARVYDTDGATALTGSTWEADLFWAPGVVTDSTLLTGLNEPTTFSTVPIQAGLFFGGTRTIPGAAAGITAQIRVWDTADGRSWAAAAASTSPTARIGESILLQVTLTSPLAQFPTELVGLNGHPWNVHFVSVPEPSTLALAGLGLAGIFCVALLAQDTPCLTIPPQRTRRSRFNAMLKASCGGSLTGIVSQKQHHG